MQKFEPLIRHVLILAALAWASAKIYFIVMIYEKSDATLSVGQPIWLYVAFGIAAISYAGITFSLFRKEYLLFGFFLFAALATNTLMFSVVQFQFLIADIVSTKSLTWYLAIVSEEYFMWTAFLTGAFVIIALKNFNRAKEILLQA